MEGLVKVIPAVFVISILVFASTLEADALRQVAGKPEFNLKPGQSDSFEWGLASDEKSKEIAVELSATGDGSEFLSFEKSISIQPNTFEYITVTVSIPDDYPGNITLTPRLFATEFGEKGATTIINVQMAKTVTLTISPNDNPDLWVDWDTLKPDPEPEVISETKEESEQMEQKEEPKQMMIIKSEKESENEQSEEGGGCLIATAAFGSEIAPQVQMLRELRDNTVLATASGTSFMTFFNQFYYSFSPTIADWERQNPFFKETVKIAITPMISSLSLLSTVNIDSEHEMLGFGIGIIALNGLMYVGVPVVGTILVKKRNKKLQLFQQ